jgi:hypothetical protein
MDAFWTLAGDVPALHWAVLAAASWGFSLICFVGSERARRRSPSAISSPTIPDELPRPRPALKRAA